MRARGFTLRIDLGNEAMQTSADVAEAELTPAAEAALDDAKDNPLAPPDTSDLTPPEADRVDAAATDGAESAFDMAMLVNGVLMITGGIVAGFGIQNPRRRDDQIAPRAAPAGECARCADDGHDGHHAEHERAAEPASA